jgi:hypothetical protein
MVCPDLHADRWVVMIGVNGDYYGFWERYYTSALLDAIYRRDRNSSIYVLNGLPLPDTLDVEYHDRLASFNVMLETMVADWQAGGRDIHLVDAFTALAPDSLFPSEYIMDKLHPNRAGYDILGREIIEVMRDDDEG